MDSCIRLDLGQWIGGIVSNYRFRPLESTIIPYPLIPSRILLHIESFNCIAANFLLERIRIFKISLSNFSFGRLSRSTFQGGGGDELEFLPRICFRSMIRNKIFSNQLFSPIPRNGERFIDLEKDGNFLWK